MEKMLSVTVYADITGYYTEQQINRLLDGACGLGNMCEVLIPESVVREWYNFIGLNKRHASFEQWFYNESTCDDMEDEFFIDDINIIRFATEKTGKKPKLDPNSKCNPDPSLI